MNSYGLLTLSILVDLLYQVSIYLPIPQTIIGPFVYRELTTALGWKPPGKFSKENNSTRIRICPGLIYPSGAVE